MNVYFWRHNRTYHSHSMIQEPCVHQEFYLDAIAVVMAANVEDALQQLAERNEGWRIEDLRGLEPKVYSMEEAKVIFTDVRG